MAPEMLQNKPYDQSLDIWCLGVLLFELVHGYPPFKGNNEREKCQNIINSRSIPFDPSLSKEIQVLIGAILKKNPQERIKMSDIFESDWFKMKEKEFNIKV